MSTEDERSMCRDCMRSLFIEEVIDGEKGLCAECVVKRLRRHEKQTDELVKIIKDAINMKGDNNPTIAFIIQSFVERNISLNRVMNGKDWYHGNATDTFIDYATGEIDISDAAYLADMDAGEFLDAYKNSSFTALEPKELE